MFSPAFWLGVVVVIVVLRWMPRTLTALVHGRRIGQIAVQRQPDSIRLLAAPDDVWRDRSAVDALADGFRGVGFTDAGCFVVHGLQGVALAILVHEQESMTAAVYDHPKAGIWCEVNSAYQDGARASYTNRPASGLDTRPGNIHQHLPGLGVADLFARALKERPRKPLCPVSIADAPRAFERAYAEGIAWRKRHGISTREVVKIATRAPTAAQTR